MNTCGNCAFYEKQGTGKGPAGNEIEVGLCFGAPPTATPAGQSHYPPVGIDNRICALFKPAKRKKL